MKLYKTSEKILIWLYRIGQTQAWLAEQLNQSKPAISQKISENMFTTGDLIRIKELGFKDQD